MDAPGAEPILSEDDALSLWVGRVARCHALLEYGVDNVHRLLVQHAGPAPGGTAMVGFGQLVERCRRLLRQSDAEHTIRIEGDEALRAATRATEARNRVVHDMWLPDPLRKEWEPPHWNAFRRSGDIQASYDSGGPRNFSEVVDSHLLVERTRLRVSGLFMALHAVWQHDHPASHKPADLSTYIALMGDRFALQPNGDFEVT